jgi:acetyl esterase/lipase
MFRVDVSAGNGFHPAVNHIFSTIAACALLGAAFPVTAADAPIALWSGTAPGDKGGLGEETDMTKPTDGMIAGKRVIRLGNVSAPTLTVYRAPKDKAAGAAVVVFPGGGYNILAMDLEGTEVCEWLNSIGVTAVLVKYRVPRRAGLEKHAAPLQDAQRAMGLVRARAAEFGIDPRRIGIIGFSAGAHLCAALAANSGQRSYPPVDDADKASCRPDFSFLIYPAYLTEKDKPDVSPEVAVSSNTPPTFIAMTQDDPINVENALHYSLALKKARVPFELHVYPKGGHGYGLRRTENPLTAWPDRAAEWMRAMGFIAAAGHGHH